MLLKKHLLLILLITVYKAGYILTSHFYGGSISSLPVFDQGATVTMEFTIRFAYRRDYSAATWCNDTTIDNLVLFGPSANILCKAGCITTNEIIGTTTEYCSSYSAQNDWSYGYKSFVIIEL